MFVFDYLKKCDAMRNESGDMTQHINPAKTANSRLFNCVQLCEIENLIKYICVLSQKALSYFERITMK